MLRRMLHFLSFVLATFVVFSGNVAFASMSSTNFQILWDSVSTGGSDTASSASYQLRDTIGQMTSGRQTSASYATAAGYRPGITDPIVQIAYHIEDRTTQVAATVLLGTTVTVTATTDYAVDDYIAVVQNEGASQVAAIGKVASLTLTTLTVDAWTTNGTSPTIDGTSDYVYALTGSAVSLGTLASTSVSTGIIAWEVTADVSQGYGVYVFDDGDLQAPGGLTFADVGDGLVSAGSTEYGGISTDTSLATSTFDTADSAFTTTPQLVASRASFAHTARDFLTVRAAISSSQSEGAYTELLTLVLVGDY